MIYTVKGFGIVNKAEIDVFLELSCFFSDPVDVGNLISVRLPFLNPAWPSGSSWLMYCWTLAWRIYEHYFASLWDECICVVVWTLALPFFGIGMKTDLFQSCGHCWAFQICSAVAKFSKLKLSQIWTSLWYSSCVILTCLLQSSGTTLVSL